MKRKLLLALFLSSLLILSSSPKVFATNTIESNSTDWLMIEVAKLLNKDNQTLNQNDYDLITTLDLSNKNLQGSIPETIGKLKNLSSLKINNNNLTGDIPESIGSLAFLTYLDLSNNNFTKLSQNITDKIINKSYSYINIDGTSIKLNKGIYFLKGKSYFLNKDNKIETGWKLINDSWLYLNPEGSIATGWKLVDESWFYLNPNGSMATGWKLVDDSWFYLNPEGSMATGLKHIADSSFYLNANGVMATGWKFAQGSWFYLNPNGSMEKCGFKIIDQETYYLFSSGIMAADKWIENKYLQANGVLSLTTSDPTSAHSFSQLSLFNYMEDDTNGESVYQRAVDLHGGITSNNCIYFASESLRRIGFSIPNQTCSTRQLQTELSRNNFKLSYDLSDLKLGDIVFSSALHVFTFMGWYDNEYAYIVDNQKSDFDKVLHIRKITSEDFINNTSKSTHFYHL